MKNFLQRIIWCTILAIAGISSLTAQTTGSVPYLTIHTPAALADIYPFEEGVYTTSVTSSWGGDLTNDIVSGELKLVDAGADSLLCDTLNPTNFTGYIALIERGSCEFGFKALQAQQRGAVAIIIYSGAFSPNPNTPVGMGAGSSGTLVTIPTLMVGRATGLTFVDAINGGESVFVSMGMAPAGFTKLEGFLKIDDNDNCIADASDPAATNLKVLIQTSSGSNYIKTTDQNGYFRTYVNPASAPFQITPLTQNQGWSSCPGNATITTNTPDTINTNFAIQKLYDCVQLETEITTPLLRRCFENGFTVEVCNQGTATAEDAYVEVTLAPEFDPIINASLPYTTLSSDVYRFNLGDIDPLSCISFNFQAATNCDSTILGQTLCYSAHAYPDTSCVQPSSAWSGASIVVSGACQGNNVEFTITNTGTAAMSEASEYIVIQDDVMYMSFPFQLGAGQSEVVSVPANGSTWRLEAAQEANHPVPGNPSNAVEGCSPNGAFTTGYVLQFPLYDPGLAIDEECQEVIGSFDPNDKQGFPLGFTEARLIRPEVDIDYLIRFQNTGTDTAFTVVVRDTLSHALNPLSIRNVIASHPYEMEIKNNFLTFRFNQILLVDSFTNEPGSHGYLAFKISQAPDNPFGTVIDNRAGIYFDFNLPVITNTTHHEVGEVVTVVAVKSVDDIPAPKLYPNPVAAHSVIMVEGEAFRTSRYQLKDLSGKTVQKGIMNNNQLRLSNSLPGVYLLEVISDSGKLYAAKIMIK